MTGFRSGLQITTGLFLLLLLQTLPIYAQDANQADTGRITMRTGLYAGYGINVLRGSLSATELPGVIPGTGECGIFESGDGNGLALGGIIEYHFSPTLAGALRLEYSDRSGTLNYSCVDPADTRLPDGSLVTATTEHLADISLGTLGIVPGVQIRPFDFPLTFFPGPAFLLGLGGEYTLWEEIVAPQTAEFVSGGQVREYGTGTLAEGTSVSFGLYGALGYELKAGENWMLRPELSAIIPFSDDLATGGIRATSIRFTLGLSRLFREEQEPVEEPAPVAVEETPQKEKTTFTAALESDNGSGWTQSPLLIRRSLPVNTRLVPLLPYLFFDNRSAELPERYIRLGSQNRGNFTESNLRSHSILDTYSHLLNIVGKRMREHQDARLTITGTAPDVADGTPSRSLANLRAEAVRDYLRSTWGIMQDRIEIVTRHAPEVPTNPETLEGRAENRRVELSSGHPAIFAPLLFRDTSEIQEIGKVRLVVQGKSPDSIGALPFDATTSQLSFIFSGSVEWDEVDGKYSYEFPLVPSVFTKENDTILVALQPDTGEITLTETQLRLPIERDDTYLPFMASGEYSLILFDAAKSGLRDEHRRTIDTVVGLLPPNSRVEVYGYTDYLGDSLENRELSEQRANKVAEELIGRIHNLHTRGMGEDTESFSVLGLPEERMYARRVVIRVNPKQSE